MNPGDVMRLRTVRNYGAEGRGWVQALDVEAVMIAMGWYRRRPRAGVKKGRR